jgi:hypothetical protein
MTSLPLPSIRSLIVCEDILTVADNSLQVTLVNLVSTIRAVGDPPYPALQPQLCVFIQLTECRGPGTVRLEIRQADGGSAELVFATPTRQVAFPNNPLAVQGLRFRIFNCRFPRPGLYWVQFFYEDRLLGQQPIVLC